MRVDSTFQSQGPSTLIAKVSRIQNVHRRKRHIPSDSEDVIALSVRVCEHAHAGASSAQLGQGRGANGRDGWAAFVAIIACTISASVGSVRHSEIS